VLDNLICAAYKQNLTLRESGFRVLESRAQLGIAVGNLLPQTQSMTGGHTRQAFSLETANRAANASNPKTGPAGGTTQEATAAGSRAGAVRRSWTSR
jgi:outer membrane protein TolC